MEQRSEKLVRRFDFQFRAEEAAEQQALYVEGYALRFSSPTVLFELDGVEYREKIAPDALRQAEMDDVIFNYNHGGKVMARTRNHTLDLTPDASGLLIRARLDGTEEGRRLYDEIAGGYIDRMSFRFTIAEEEFDREERMWTILRIKRLYDVSAVDIPAYDDTSISARRQNVLAQREAAVRMGRTARQLAALKCKL